MPLRSARLRPPHRPQQAEAAPSQSAPAPSANSVRRAPDPDIPQEDEAEEEADGGWLRLLWEVGKAVVTTPAVRVWLASDSEGGKDLSHSDFSGADLSHQDLSDADLSFANLSGADLSYTDLSYANLSYADLTDAEMQGASLTGANLTLANYLDAKNASTWDART